MNPLNEFKARSEMLAVSKLAYERGYLCGTEGNFSIRLDEKRILTTPRGVCKARLSVSDFLVTNLDGELIGESLKQSKKPSTELAMHLTVYAERPDIRAVVHAHPETAVAFTVAGIALDAPILPEAVLALGAIPVAPYATPSTSEVSESIREIVKNSDCLLLKNHGSLTVGRTIFDAFYLLETLEHYAQTLLISRQLGKVEVLSEEQVQRLFSICSIYGIKPRQSSVKSGS